MDGSHFDALTRTIAAPLSRRVTLRGLTAGVLLACGLALDEAGGLAMMGGMGMGGMGMGGAKPCPFGRPRCGNACCTLGESCRNNRCVHTCRDEVQNNGESDTDCGRVCAGIEGAGRCELLKRCTDAQDCRSNFCVARPSGAGAVCAECFLDSDCPSQRPRCLDNLCFECSVKEDCAGLFPDPFCISVPVQTGLNPAPCPGNEPCLCAECRNDGDCPAERPDCQTDPGIGLVGRCLECVQDTDCPPQRPHCETDPSISFIGRGCVECLDDEHCPEGHLCDEQGRCEELCPGRTRRSRVRAEGDNCPDPCANGVQDGGETDVDCGGPDCPKCANSKNCLVNTDCQSGICDNEECEECASNSDCSSGCCDTGECVTSFDDNVAHCGACFNSCPGQFPSCVRCCNQVCMEFSRDGNPNCDCP